MSISSYQTLARYDDCSIGVRARSTNDIRQRQREQLSMSRIENKLLQRLRLRRITLTDDDCESTYQDDDEEPGEFFCDVVDFPSSLDCTPALDGWDSNYPYNTPSPSLSNDSDCNSVSASDSVGWGSPRQLPCDSRRIRRSRSMRGILLKRKRAQIVTYDGEAIRRDYLALKSYIMHHLDNSSAIGFNLCGRWTTLAEAIDHEDEQLSEDSLQFFSELITRRLINNTDVLHILQQGLFITLKDTMQRMGTQQTNVINLLTSIMRTDPNAIPYVIELLTDSQAMDSFDDLLSVGTDNESITVVQFYSELFSLLATLNFQGSFQPSLPKTISQAYSATRISELYSPHSALKRIVRPGLVNTLVARYFNQLSNLDRNSIQLVLSLTADCLNFAYVNLHSTKPDYSWANSLIKVFQDSQADYLISRALNNGANRTLSHEVRSDLDNFLKYHQEMSIRISSLLLTKCS